MLGSTWQGRRGQGEEGELEVALTLEPKLWAHCPILTLLVSSELRLCKLHRGPEVPLGLHYLRSSQDNLLPLPQGNLWPGSLLTSCPPL